MGYQSAPSQRVVRACGREYYFSKIAFILNKLQQGKTLAPKLQRHYAPWIEWLGKQEQNDRAVFIAFILRAGQDCPAVLLSVDIWAELMAAWRSFRQEKEGEAALLAELQLYGLLLPGATNAGWSRHLRVMAGEAGEEPLRFFAELIMEQSGKTGLSDEDWNDTALRLLGGAKINRLRQDLPRAKHEIRRFFSLLENRSRVPGIRLYQGCRIASAPTFGSAGKASVPSGRCGIPTA